LFTVPQTLIYVREAFMTAFIANEIVQIFSPVEFSR